MTKTTIGQVGLQERHEIVYGILLRSIAEDLMDVETKCGQSRADKEAFRCRNQKAAGSTINEEVEGCFLFS